MRHREYEYSHDEEFLKEMDELHLSEQYVKMTLLDWNERPIEDIQGRVTGGNLNLDGKSSMRRTCNLQAYIENENDANITRLDNIFSINKKMYLEIGLKNMTQKYRNHEIIWYPQGVFVMITPAISHSTGGSSISVTLKDKMCLLNGECGGVIPASTQFDKMDTRDENGNWVVERPLILQTITNLVNHFGGEDLSKIFVNDIDTRIKQVMRWKGNQPLYMYHNGTERKYTTEIPNSGQEYETYLKDDDIGYIYVDFTYPHDQELIANAGDNVCTILDKIKGTLGNSYEYFYDIDGNFIWQEIKNYLNTTRATMTIQELNNQKKKALDEITAGSYVIKPWMDKKVYDFDDNLLVSSYANTPQFNMIKNDFLVWGIRKNAEGMELPIRYHLAIDQRPKVQGTININGEQVQHYGIYNVGFYIDPDDKIKKAVNPIIFSDAKAMQEHKGFARNFYKIAGSDDIYKWENGEYVLATEVSSLQPIPALNWRTALYLQGLEAEPLSYDRPYYDQELYNEWPKIYDVENGKYYEEAEAYPNKLDFYLDIIDSGARIAELSVSNIGRRTVVINDNSVNCLFEPIVPDFVVIEIGQDDTQAKRDECIKRGQNYIQVDSSIYKSLSIGGKYNSAYKVIRDLLYQHTSYNEAISLQAVPIFHLEPNTRIGATDAESNIYGDYMISTISIPLAASGTMTISATKAIERI